VEKRVGMLYLKAVDNDKTQASLLIFSAMKCKECNYRYVEKRVGMHI
jgi:hypothetical protein